MQRLTVITSRWGSSYKNRKMCFCCPDSWKSSWCSGETEMLLIADGFGSFLTGAREVLLWGRDWRNLNSLVVFLSIIRWDLLSVCTWLVVFRLFWKYLPVLTVIAHKLNSKSLVGLWVLLELQVCYTSPDFSLFRLFWHQRFFWKCLAFFGLTITMQEASAIFPSLFLSLEKVCISKSALQVAATFGFLKPASATESLQPSCLMEEQLAFSSFLSFCF